MTVRKVDAGCDGASHVNATSSSIGASFAANAGSASACPSAFLTCAGNGPGNPLPCEGRTVESTVAAKADWRNDRRSIMHLIITVPDQQALTAPEIPGLTLKNWRRAPKRNRKTLNVLGPASGTLQASRPASRDTSPVREDACLRDSQAGLRDVAFAVERELRLRFI